MDKTKERIYIKNLPLDELIYTLWLHAKTSSYLLECNEEDVPILTYKKIQKDLPHFYKSIPFDLNIYYGRMMYVRIENEYMDISHYNIVNRIDINKKIRELKKKEMKKLVLKYYIM